MMLKVQSDKDTLHSTALPTSTKLSLLLARNLEMQGARDKKGASETHHSCGIGGELIMLPESTNI